MDEGLNNQMMLEIKKVMARNSRFEAQSKQGTRQSSNAGRSQNSTEINKDIASTVANDIKNTQLNRPKTNMIKAPGEFRRRPGTQPRVDTIPTALPATQCDESPLIPQPYHIKVNMAKDSRSFVETEQSGGSGMRLSTVYDTSPNRLLLQQHSSQMNTMNGYPYEPAPL